MAAPSVKLALSQALIVQKDGKTVATAVPEDGAKYGSTLRYTIVAKNGGDKPALNVLPVGRIPHGVTFIAKSATPASAQYTLDGKSWSAKPMVEVKEANGKRVKKPADPSTYVGVRWKIAKLLPKKTETFTYEVTVR